MGWTNTKKKLLERERAEHHNTNRWRTNYKQRSKMNLALASSILSVLSRIEVLQSMRTSRTQRRYILLLAKSVVDFCGMCGCRWRRRRRRRWLDDVESLTLVIAPSTSPILPFTTRQTSFIIISFCDLAGCVRACASVYGFQRSTRKHNKHSVLDADNLIKKLKCATLLGVWRARYHIDEMQMFRAHIHPELSAHLFRCACEHHDCTSIETWSTNVMT